MTTATPVTPVQEFDLDAVRAGLREIVTGREGFVYQHPEWSLRCLYAHGSEPGCLIGQYLHKLGVPIATLEGLDQIGGITSGTVQDHLQAAGVSFTDEAADYMGWAQNRQDAKHPWGEALAFADVKLGVAG